MLCRVALLCTTLDLPARAAVLNFIQFNGYWGCCRCLQKGKLTHNYFWIDIVCHMLTNHCFFTRDKG